MFRIITKRMINIVKNNVLHRDIPLKRKRYQYVEKNKQSTLPVSAFFLIDSLDAIEKCIEKLSILKRYNMPNIEDSGYFENVCEIFKSKKDVWRYDKDVKLSWDNKEYPAKVRFNCRRGTYEIELWIPGVIANDAKDMLGDGRDGFWCIFMPPQFFN